MAPHCNFCHLLEIQNFTDYDETFASINEKPPWLAYHSEKESISHNYNNYLDRMSFATNAIDKRGKFVIDFKDHVDDSTFRFCRLHGDQIEFKEVILDF